VIKIVMIDSVVADARADKQFRIRNRADRRALTDAQIGNVIVGAEKKTLRRFNARFRLSA
jgi:hypothetical protein